MYARFRDVCLWGKGSWMKDEEKRRRLFAYSSTSLQIFVSSGLLGLDSEWTLLGELMGDRLRGKINYGKLPEER